MDLYTSIYMRSPYLKAERKFNRAERHWWIRAFVVLLIGGAIVLLSKWPFDRSDIAEAAWAATICTSVLPVLFAMRTFRRKLRLIDHAHEIARRQIRAYLSPPH